jgi:hypothetical protein
MYIFYCYYISLSNNYTNVLLLETMCGNMEDLSVWSMNIKQFDYDQVKGIFSFHVQYLLLIYIYIYIHKEGQVWILLTSLTLPHFCADPSQDFDFNNHVPCFFYVQQFGVKSGSLLC